MTPTETFEAWLKARKYSDELSAEVQEAQRLMTELRQRLHLARDNERKLAADIAELVNPPIKVSPAPKFESDLG